MGRGTRATGHRSCPVAAVRQPRQVVGAERRNSTRGEEPWPARWMGTARLGRRGRTEVRRVPVRPHQRRARAVAEAHPEKGSRPGEASPRGPAVFSIRPAARHDSVAAAGLLGVRSFGGVHPAFTRSRRRRPGRAARDRYRPPRRASPGVNPPRKGPRKNSFEHRGRRCAPAARSGSAPNPRRTEGTPRGLGRSRDTADGDQRRPNAEVILARALTGEQVDRPRVGAPRVRARGADQQVRTAVPVEVDRAERCSRPVTRDPLEVGPPPGEGDVAE